MAGLHTASTWGRTVYATMIREVVLDEIVLEEIRKTVYYARAKTSEFVS